MTSMLPEIIQDIDQKSFAEMEIEEPHPNWSKTVCFNNEWHPCWQNNSKVTFSFNGKYLKCYLIVIWYL